VHSTEKLKKLPLALNKLAPDTPSGDSFTLLLPDLINQSAMWEISFKKGSRDQINFLSIEV
jgi:hypothetical protein